MENIGQLLLQLQKAHRATIADKLAALNLYPGQDGLLYHLSRHDGQTMSELVEKIQVSHATLSIMVDRMEKTGLITKSKDREDKRISRIFLSNKGRKQIGHLSAIWQDIEKKLLVNFSQEEKTATITMLHKLINNLRS